MDPTAWRFDDRQSVRAAGKIVSDHRARLEDEAREKAERRRRELAEQCSSQVSPEMRIRTWERLHGLRLPADAAHPALDSIAIATRLTLEQVHEEQRARAARRASLV